MLRELLSDPAGLLVQGITGSQGQLETRWMLESGVNVAAGVTPGKSGESVQGVPVYNTVAEAVQRHGTRISMVYVPPLAAADAALEAIEAGIQLVVIAAESVPLHRLIRAIEAAQNAGARIIGPNSQGVAIPGVGRIGCPGGTDPHLRFRAGHVAVVSRSGGMCSEIASLIRNWGWGTSVQVHVGGAPLVATDLTEGVALVQRDPATHITVVVGEPSGLQEELLAEAVAQSTVALPIIALIAGSAADELPSILPFGHAPRAGHGGSTVAGKIDALRAVNIQVARNTRELYEQILLCSQRMKRSQCIR